MVLFLLVRCVAVVWQAGDVAVAVDVMWPALWRLVGRQLVPEKAAGVVVVLGGYGWCI